MTRNFLYLLSRKTIRTSITKMAINYIRAFQISRLHLSGESYSTSGIAGPYTGWVPPKVSCISSLAELTPPIRISVPTTVHASRALTGHDVFSWLIVKICLLQ